MGIGGVLNTSGNDGSVDLAGRRRTSRSTIRGRSLQRGTGSDERSISNQRSDVVVCLFNPTPEDHLQVAVMAVSTDRGGTNLPVT